MAQVINLSFVKKTNLCYSMYVIRNLINLTTHGANKGVKRKKEKAHLLPKAKKTRLMLPCIHIIAL
ncbi:unnamed protein product, partial [Sphenostylis stenocarpa]